MFNDVLMITQSSFMSLKNVGDLQGIKSTANGEASVEKLKELGILFFFSL